MGIRFHVGPRFLRLHFGSGRTGVSTGLGPVTLYSSGRKRKARKAEAFNFRPEHPAPERPPGLNRQQIERIIRLYDKLDPEAKKLAARDVEEAIAIYLISPGE